MKIRAAVLHEVGQPLIIEELELDPPGQGEVLVQMKAAGLCHSDLSTMTGVRPRPRPMAIGHEAAGVVAELGPGVSDLAVGDHVVTTFTPNCGRCTPCRSGRPALCEPAFAANSAGTLLGGGRRLHLNGKDVHHQVGVSSFAEHAVMNTSSLVPVDKDLPLDEAALFGCAIITGVGAVINTARVPLGASVAVVGRGGVGLAALLGAKLAGARRLVAIDLRDDKLALARQLGASDTFSAADEGCAEAVREATGGGVEYAIEIAGSTPALELAWAITARGGTTVTAGLPHYEDRAAISPVQLVGEERTLKGSYAGSCVPARDIPHFVELYRQGKLPVDRLLSERLTLDQVNQGFDRLAAGDMVRQMVMFD
jgi:alcohol dehydrogenase